MDATAFNRIYHESRNGANGFYSHWAARKFQYSDGVHDLAELGCHWMLDILATELPAVMREYPNQPFGVLQIQVLNGKAILQLNLEDDRPNVWRREVDYTDLPEGGWTFYIVDEGERVAMILPNEH